MLKRAAIVLAALSCVPSIASAQVAAIPPGKEAIILEAVQEAFVESPARAIAVERAIIRVDTGRGPHLVAARTEEIAVTVECEGGCDAETLARWTPVATRLEASLGRRADSIWMLTVTRRYQYEPVSSPGALRARQAISFALLAIALVAFVVAPGRRIFSRRSALVAVVTAIGFVVVGLTLSAPRPLHDHLCFLERARCAETLRCDVVHHAWGRPTFHLMGLLFQLVPHRVAWIHGLGVVVSGAALYLVYDVTARVARRAGLDARADEAGLWAAGLLALHPGLLRMAGAGSFWPLTLVLLFGALHLFLRAAEGEGWRRTAALFGAGAALGLTLGGNRLVLGLAPMLVLAVYAWPVRGARPWHALAALPAIGLGGVALFDVFGGVHYGAGGLASRPWAALASMLSVPAKSALMWSFTTPLLLPVALVAVASRERARATLPLCYAFVAIATLSLHFAGPMEWRAYPDGYLKHQPQLHLIAPLFGIGVVVLLGFVGSRLQRGVELLAPAALLLLVATAWTRPDATRLLFAERVMERELVALERAFEELPPHDVLVVAGILPPPAGLEPGGDPLEMHFPVGIYRAVLEARGLEPAEVIPLRHALSRPELVDGRALLYVGSTLRSFYRSEIEAGQVPASRERPELARLRERFAFEPVRVFSVSTREPAVSRHPVAPGWPEVELGFYRLSAYR